MSAVDDSLLEQMTSALLEISSTFLVQQNELTEVKERLNKESLRVASIQELLTLAAQKHQDAVLAVIQNYENLATELPPATPPVARSSSVPLPLSATPRSASSSVDSSSGAAPAKEFLTVAQVHMPPAATQPSIFRQLPKLGDDDDDDEGGIDYVANLQVSGGILGPNPNPNANPNPNPSPNPSPNSTLTAIGIGTRRGRAAASRTRPACA